MFTLYGPLLKKIDDICMVTIFLDIGIKRGDCGVWGRCYGDGVIMLAE